MGWFISLLNGVLKQNKSDLMTKTIGGKMKLSENFSVEEFGCKDGTPYPEEWVETKLKPLVEQLEVIRAYFGNKPITITSSYRTPGYNKKVGGATKSQHVEGIAVDFKVQGVEAREVADKVTFLMKNGKILKGGVGSYYSWTHYDTRGVMATWRE